MPMPPTTHCECSRSTTCDGRESGGYLPHRRRRRRDSWRGSVECDSRRACVGGRSWCATSTWNDQSDSSIGRVSRLFDLKTKLMTIKHSCQALSLGPTRVTQSFTFIHPLLLPHTQHQQEPAARTTTGTMSRCNNDRLHSRNLSSFLSFEMRTATGGS